MECQCGSEACRKLITRADWRKLELQQKYDGYFSWVFSDANPFAKATSQPRQFAATIAVRVGD
jgi:hypothetical protein